MVSRILWSLVLAGALGLQIGCSQAQMESWLYPSMKDVKEFAKLEQEQHTAHDDNMTEQHVKMHPDAEAAIRTQKAEFDARMADIAKRTEELKGSIAANFKKITEEALKLATGFTGLAAFTKTTDKRVGDLGDESDTARAARAATEKTLAEARTVLERMTKDMAEAEENLASLSEGTQEKLLAANADTVSRLDKLREDDSAFRAELKDSLNLSVSQMKELEGMSPNEIMALLGLAGAAAGIGVAGGRTGKSRSHQEVEKVKTTIAKLLADLERQKQPRA